MRPRVASRCLACGPACATAVSRGPAGPLGRGAGPARGGACCRSCCLRAGCERSAGSGRRRRAAGPDRCGQAAGPGRCSTLARSGGPGPDSGPGRHGRPDRADRPRRGDRTVLWRGREQRARRGPEPGCRPRRVHRPLGRAPSPAPLHQPARSPCRSAGRGPITTAPSGDAVAAAGPGRRPRRASRGVTRVSPRGLPPTSWTRAPAPWCSCSPWPPSRSLSAS